jgi:transposase
MSSATEVRVDRDFVLSAAIAADGGVPQMTARARAALMIAGRALELTAGDRRQLNAWVRAGTTPQRVVRRARIVLLAAEGLSARAIARELGVSPHTAALWRRQFQRHGPAALLRDAPGRGRKATVARDAGPRLRALLETAPPGGGRWTIRRIAQTTGISRASVHRILRAERPGFRSGRRASRQG